MTTPRSRLTWPIAAILLSTVIAFAFATRSDTVEESASDQPELPFNGGLSYWGDSLSLSGEVPNGIQAGSTIRVRFEGENGREISRVVSSRGRISLVANPGGAEVMQVAIDLPDGERLATYDVPLTKLGDYNRETRCRGTFAA